MSCNKRLHWVREKHGQSQQTSGSIRLNGLSEIVEHISLGFIQKSQVPRHTQNEAQNGAQCQTEKGHSSPPGCRQIPQGHRHNKRRMLTRKGYRQDTKSNKESAIDPVVGQDLTESTRGCHRTCYGCKHCHKHHQQSIRRHTDSTGERQAAKVPLHRQRHHNCERCAHH